MLSPEQNQEFKWRSTFSKSPSRERLFEKSVVSDQPGDRLAGRFAAALSVGMVHRTKVIPKHTVVCGSVSDGIARKDR